MQDARIPYLLAVTALFVKYVALISVQGSARFRTRRFRWPEDAVTWKGETGPEEDETVERAQAALRNDGESHVFFLVFGGAWVLLGADLRVAWPLCATYAVARLAHGYFLVRPRQPLRNRCFVVGQLALLVLVVDALRLALL